MVARLVRPFAPVSVACCESGEMLVTDTPPLPATPNGKPSIRQNLVFRLVIRKDRETCEGGRSESRVISFSSAATGNFCFFADERERKGERRGTGLDWTRLDCTGLDKVA